MRRTKIVATVGPATSSPEAMRALLAAGADVVRLNAAHGDVATHTERAAMSRTIAADLGQVVGVLVDMPGPKMRSGPVAGDEVELDAGEQFILTATPVDGDTTRVSTSLPELARWVDPGSGGKVFAI
jgi:pyruvate kinase